MANIEPVAILIRSDVHNTTTRFVDGHRVVVPHDWHITVSAKSHKQSEQGEHITFHGYVNSKWATELLEVKGASAKADSILKGTAPNRKPTWPQAEALYRLEDEKFPDLIELFKESQASK